MIGIRKMCFVIFKYTYYQVVGNYYLKKIPSQHTMNWVGGELSRNKNNKKPIKFTKRFNSNKNNNTTANTNSNGLDYSHGSSSSLPKSSATSSTIIDNIRHRLFGQSQYHQESDLHNDISFIYDHANINNRTGNVLQSPPPPSTRQVQVAKVRQIQKTNESGNSSSSKKQGISLDLLQLEANSEFQSK